MEEDHGVFLPTLAHFGTFISNPHRAPHLDELAAAWMIRQFGTADWAKEHAVKGAVELGRNGGEFDEHPHQGRVRKYRECCMTLVASSLGVRDLSVLKSLLDYALFDDTNAVRGRNDIARLMQMFKTAFPDQEMRIWNWGLLALDGWYAVARVRQSQPEFMPVAAGYEFDLRYLAACVHFHLGRAAVDQFRGWQQVISQTQEAEKNGREAAVLEISQHGTVKTIKSKTTGISRRILVIHSANPWLAAVYGRKAAGQNAGLLQFQPQGFIAILAKSSGLHNNDVIKTLRKATLNLAPEGKQRLARYNDKQLQCDGFLDGENTLYFQKAAQRILNGAHSNRGVPKSPLNTGFIQMTVINSYQRQVNAMQEEAVPVS